MGKHISAYTGVKRISAPTMTAASTDKQSTGKRVSAFRNYALDREIAEKKANEKNKGGLIGGAGYTLEKGALGAIQNVEGAADFVTAGAADLVGADELAEKIMDDDWVDYGHADKWYNPDKGMQVVGDVSGAIGSMIPNLTVAGGTALVNAALTAVTHGGYAAAVPWVQRIVPSLYAGISAAGNATKEAYRKTGELGFKEWGYGGLVGATEAGVEALTAGIGKGTGRLVAKFGKKAVGEATEAVGKYGIKGLLNTLGKDMLSEGLEEGFATFMSPIYAKATYDPDAEMATAGEVFYDAAIGSIAGLIFSGADVAVSFGSSVDAGKKVSDAGKADQLIKQATYGLAQIRVEMEGAQSKLADVEASNELTKWGKARQKKQIKRTAENRAQASKAIEEALLRWESLTPEQRKSVKGFEVLGDLQKNDFLLRANAWVETRAGALSEQSDEGLSRIAEQIREGTGETYTVEELRANKDDVLTRIACSMLAITGLENGEATQSTAQAGEDAAQGAESDGLTEWEGLRDNDDMTPYGARSEAEGYLLAAAAREGVPRASIPAMMEAYRAGTSLSPEEFVDGWLDAVKLYGNGAAGHTSYAADSALGRMTESQRAAAMEQGRLYGEAQARAKAKAEGKAQTDANAKAEAKKEKTSDGAEVKYSTQKDNSIIEIEADAELERRIRESSKSKYDVIREYLVEKFHGQTFNLSDGRIAIMDKSDAKELSHKANESRTAQLGNLRKIVEEATYDHSVYSVDHNKFTDFHYYAASVRYNGEIYHLWINVGVAKNDKQNHIYSITKNEEAPTHYGVSRPVGNAIQNASSIDSISQPKPSVKRKIVGESKKSPGRVILADGLNVRNDFNDRQYASYKAAELMAKVLGVDIVFHRSLHHGADVAAGYFSPKDGSIHININAMRDGQNIALYTLGHETVHYIKEWSPRKYAELESFVLRKLTESGQDVKALEEAKRAQLEESGDLKGLTEEQADALVREEVVAEAMEGVLSDGEVLADLQKRHRSLWEKIRDFVLSVIDKVKATFNDLNGASQTARVLRDTVDALDGMKQLFYEGVVEAAEARKSGVEATTKTIRLSWMNRESLNDNVDQVLKMDEETAKRHEAEGRYVSIMDATPDVILDHVKDAKDLEIIMRFDAFYLATRRHGALKGHYHNYGEIMKKLPKIISNPEAIVRMKDGRLNLLASVPTAKGAYSIVSVELNTVKDINSAYDKYNLVVSVIPANDNYMRNNLLKRGTKVEYQKEDLPQVNHQLYEWLAIVNDKSSTGSIPPNGDSVNTSNENSQKKNLESADKHSAGGDITESTDVYENEESPFHAAVRRSGIDPESEAMIRSIEDSSKDLREDERAAWQADVERLGSYVKAQKAAAVSPAFTPKAMENAVGKVMSVIGAKRGRAELTERMTELYRHIATSDTLTYEDIMERAEAIADELIEAQPPTPVPVDGVYGDILTDLKQTPMTLTSTQMQEVADRYGSYENFRRKMFGKWKLSKEGVALDVLWQEWAGQYPEFFDPDMTEGDMVDALVKIYDEAYRAQNAVEYIEKAAVMQPLTMAIYNGYWELPAAPDPLYAAYQKDLAEQRGEADREQQRALARQRGEHKRAMAELQKQHERRIQKMNARMKELMRQRDRMELGQKVSTQTKEITVRTRAARRVLGRLNTMFFNQTKTKHVPQALRSLVEQVLSSEDLGDFQTLRKHMREISELESKIEQLEREPALTGEQQKKLDAMRYRYDELASASLAPKAQAEALFKAFEEYNQKTNKGATLDADLMKRLSDDVKAMEGKPLSEMGVESIRAVEDFYKLLYHQINNANTLFAEERAEQISQLGDASVKEVEGSKLLKFLSPKEMEWAGLSSVRSFILKNLKPLTVFEATGSKTLQGLFQRVLDGEGVWANDVQGVHEKIKGIREKYDWQSWKMDERVAIETKSGTVRLSLSEMMSLYAYSFREQAISHLEGGGFVLDPSATAKGKYPLKVLEQKVNDARRYVMDMETMGALASQLTEEQKSYVKEMQAVLSEMGELGNEVSRKLYDMDLFNEKHYFPIKVRSDYLESQTGRTGDPNIKNRGAFKQTVPDADNPLVLEAFDKVFADHVNSMATYHAFVLPVEDLMRVFNHNPSNASVDEQGNWVVDESAKSYSTVKAAISGRYGEDVVKYIEQVVRDLNGGARRDATASILDSGITAFKRASTMASLSVLIQQPTSLIRAGAYIDYKYLMNTKGFIDLKNHKANWERLCKYAPVGVIKEMGGYDTGVGARTTEYLNAKEYKTLSERAGAFFKPEALGGDANYRAEIFGRGAAFADEVAWIQMFEACVSEQAEKLKKPRDAEEVLTAAGKRFTEIVRRTQVYDSTLTRSELMRSKDTGMKMATAFGAEPTTIVSMVADAIIRGERGDVKFLRKSGGALAAAIIINAMAVSLVYAMRDDDEDKTYAEKYLSTLSAEIVEGFIPLSYLPFARDVMSLAQGYEVERSDMTLIGNLFDQMKLLTSSKRSVTDKVLGVTGAVSAFFGLPVTNMVRDAKGLINTFLGQTDTERTTGAGVSAALKEEFTTIFGLFDEQTTNQYQLYDAVMKGDVAHYERVAARYDSEKAVEQALRKALRENDPRIHEAAVARIEGEREVYESLIAQIEGEGHFDRDIIIRAINNQINYINDHAEDETVPKDEAAAAEAEEELHEALYSAKDLNAALERGDTEDFIAMADILVYYKIDAGKTEAQAKASIKSSVTRYWKEKWIEAWKNNDTAEIKRIQSVLVSTGLYGDRNQVAELGQGWVKAYAAKAGLVSVSSSQTAGSGRIRLGN